MTELQKRMAAAYEANKEFLPREGRKIRSRKPRTPACSAPETDTSTTPWLAFWKKQQEQGQ